MNRKSVLLSAVSWRWLLALPCIVALAPTPVWAHNFMGMTNKTIELLRNQEDGYRFLILKGGERPPIGFEEANFDDSRFSSGRGAFGSGGECELPSIVNTEWPVGTQLIVRNRIFVPEQRVNPDPTANVGPVSNVKNLRIVLSADNDILGVFFDGKRIAPFTRHDGCPVADQFVFSVPDRMVTPGEHVVTFHIADRGVESFFDARVIGEFIVAGDLLQGVTDHAPLLVPVSDTSIQCASGADPVTVHYRVAGSKERGRIEVKPSDAGFAARFFLNDKLMAVMSKKGRDVSSSASAEFERRLNTPDGIDPGALSLDAVLVRDDVREGLIRCFLARVSKSPGSLVAPQRTRTSRSTAPNRGGEPPPGGLEDCNRTCEREAADVGLCQSFCSDQIADRVDNCEDSCTSAVGLACGLAGVALGTNAVGGFIGGGLSIAVGVYVAAECVEDATACKPACKGRFR